MDFRSDPALQRLAAEARQLASSWPTATNDSWVTASDRPFSLELGRRGWLGMTWPVEVGGGGRPAIERFVVTEALVSAGAPVAATWVGDRQIGPTLVAYGTRSQQECFLPSMIDGSASWCIGMSEPDSGSDLASLRTRAEPDGSNWRLTGRKVWTSFATDAHHCYVIARTHDTGRRHEGLSEMIIDLDQPGVTVRPIPDATGARHFCEVELDGVEVPAARLVGEPGGSWRQLMRQLEHERSGIERLLSNRLLYEAALAVADRHDRRVRDEIARLESTYRLGRLLVAREALGQAPPHSSAMTKLLCTEHEQRVAAFAASALGAEATLAGEVARAIAYGPAYTIQGGTSEILRTLIAERALGLPRA